MSHTDPPLVLAGMAIRRAGHVDNLAADIVARLRAWRLRTADCDVADEILLGMMLLEAADEIERLRHAFRAINGR